MDRISFALLDVFKTNTKKAEPLMNPIKVSYVSGQAI